MMMGLMNFGEDEQQMPPVANPIPSGVTMPPPHAAQLPQAQAPQQRPSLMARIGHALAAAGGAVSDRIRPEAPVGYDGLLSHDEIERARPSLLHSLIGAPDSPSADQRYRNNLDSAIEHKSFGMQMQRQQEIMGARKQLMTKFPIPQNGSEQELSQWANRVMPFLMQSGDYEGVKMLAPLNEQFAKNHEKTYAPQLFKGPSGELRYFEPNESTQLPAGWQPFAKPGSQTSGTPQLFRSPDGKKYVGIAPGDNETLAKYSQMGYKPEVTARSEFVQSNVMTRADRVDERVRVNSFNAQTKPLRERAAVIDQAIRTIDDAAHNPDPRVRKTLYSSAVANFVQAADQKAQIRYQLLNYFKDNVDPSIAGKWSLLKSRLLDGSLPEYTMEGMLIHLQNLREMTKEHYNAQRSGMIDRHPELEESLPGVEEFFPEDGAGIGGKGAKEAAPAVDEGAARAAWAKVNPPKKGETREQYKARFENSRRGK